MDVLQIVAPRGIVLSAEAAYADTVAHLQAEGHQRAVAETVGRQVQKLCHDKGIWSIEDGRRCLLLPHAQFGVKSSA